MNAPFPRRDRRRRAFTFIELLTVLCVIGVGVYFASVGTTSQNSYYYLRGDVDKIVAALQKAAVQSATLGIEADDVNLSGLNVLPSAGVTFFNGRVGANGNVDAFGYSIVNWFTTTPQNAPTLPANIARPAVNLTTLKAGSPSTWTVVRNLHPETILCRQYNGATVATSITPLTDQSYFEFRKGRLNCYGADETIVPPAFLDTPFLQLDGLYGANARVAWSFDVVNLNVGWVRVRVLVGGFVEASAINAVGTVTAKYQSGADF